MTRARAQGLWHAGDRAAGDRAARSLCCAELVLRGDGAAWGWRCVGIALRGDGAAWRWRCVGSYAHGSSAAWELSRMAVALCGGCAAWRWRWVRVVPYGSSAGWEIVSHGGWAARSVGAARPCPEIMLGRVVRGARSSGGSRAWEQWCWPSIKPLVCREGMAACRSGCRPAGCTSARTGKFTRSETSDCVASTAAAIGLERCAAGRRQRGCRESISVELLSGGLA